MVLSLNILKRTNKWKHLKQWHQCKNCPKIDYQRCPWLRWAFVDCFNFHIDVDFQLQIFFQMWIKRLILNRHDSLPCSMNIAKETCTIIYDKRTQQGYSKVQSSATTKSVLHLLSMFIFHVQWLARFVVKHKNGVVFSACIELMFLRKSIQCSRHSSSLQPAQLTNMVTTVKELKFLFRLALIMLMLH